MVTMIPPVSATEATQVPLTIGHYAQLDGAGLAHLVLGDGGVGLGIEGVLQKLAVVGHHIQRVCGSLGLPGVSAMHTCIIEYSQETVQFRESLYVPINNIPRHLRGSVPTNNIFLETYLE